MSISADRVDLSDNDAELLAQASRIMSEALDRPKAHRISLVEQQADGSDSARLEVPTATLRLLSQILALMARQQTFVLYPESSELTTKQAAEVLGVSRPFLIRVLEAGEIPYRKVGRHRRVLMKDVLLHKQANQVKRRAALDELVKTSEEMGGYDLWWWRSIDSRFFNPKWSARIRTEWMRNLTERLGERPFEGNTVVRVRRIAAAMDAAFPDAAIEFEWAEAAILEPVHVKDRHVVAAAMAVQADAILTFNIADFAVAHLKEHLQIDVIHPDDFVMDLVDLHEKRAVSAFRELRARKQNPPWAPSELIPRLQRSGLVQTSLWLSTEDVVALIWSRNIIALPIEGRAERDYGDCVG